MAFSRQCLTRNIAIFDIQSHSPVGLASSRDLPAFCPLAPSNTLVAIFPARAAHVGLAQRVALPARGHASEREGEGHTGRAIAASDQSRAESAKASSSSATKASREARKGLTPESGARENSLFNMSWFAFLN